MASHTQAQTLRCAPKAMMCICGIPPVLRYHCCAMSVDVGLISAIVWLDSANFLRSRPKFVFGQLRPSSGRAWPNLAEVGIRSRSPKLGRIQPNLGRNQAIVYRHRTHFVEAGPNLIDAGQVQDETNRCSNNFTLPQMSTRSVSVRFVVDLVSMFRFGVDLGLAWGQSG